MADFSYTNFNGSVVTLPSAPEELFNYSNYVVFRSGSNYYFFCFDKIIECSTEVVDGRTSFYINYNNNAFVKTFKYSGTFKQWYEPASASVSTNFSTDGCSDNLLKYKDLIVTTKFSIDLSQEELVMFTLRPIVQEVDERENILKSTFDEVFSILPVLITVLISFIGIRKGISFLISQINKS